MRFVPIRSLEDVYWYSFNDEPIATGNPFLTPRLSDPSFLLPDETPDALWHLFAHTWQGVEHYTSTSGLEWKRERLLFFLAHSPSIYKEGSIYYMLYEVHARDPRRRGENTSSSRIMLTSSSDLSLWSEPRRILDSADIPSSSWRGGRRRLFMPQLIQWQGRYRLYFGAGEAEMYDSGEKTAATLMCAESYYLEGPYEIAGKPVMVPDPESRYRSLAAGSVRIIPCSDAVAAVSSPRYYDRAAGRSKSVMLLSRSEDGLSFSDCGVMQTTPDSGWASGYITQCDLRYKENEETWYCYYSADGYPDPRIPFRRESLGLLLGRKR